MVSGTVSRFAWAFNDPAFSDVCLVLHTSNFDDNIGYKKSPVIDPYGCNRRNHTCSAGQLDDRIHSARRGCARTPAANAHDSCEAKDFMCETFEPALSRSAGGEHKQIVWDR